MSSGATLRRRILPTDFALYLIAALGSTLAVWLLLGLWTIPWDVPFIYSGDALAVASHFKTVIETGWYEWQPALGAPYGQNYHDYPTSENLHFLVALILGGVTQNWAVAMNLHFLLGFPLAAVAMVWLLRKLGNSGVTAVVVSIIFALAPYHFSRGEGHLFLAWYWVVPFALGLVYAMLRGDAVWGRRQNVPRGLGHLLGRTGGTVTILVLLGSASTYYSFFTVLLGGIAAMAAVWTTRNWRRLWGSVAAAGLLLAVVLANMAPDFVYRLVNGANSAALQRTPVESEVYALKLSQLLLPPAWHRFPPFSHLRQQYDTHYPLPSESPTLGLVAAVGLIVLIGAVFYLVATVVSRREPTPGGLALRLAPLGFLVVVAFLFSTVGGLSTLISFVSTNLRAWNRMSIVIAALSLVAVAFLLDHFIHWLVGREMLVRFARPTVVALVVTPVLVLALWDQTPPFDEAAHAATVASFESDDSFVTEIESQLPSSALVYQLPYIDFPESPPVGRALDSDQLRPFLHSDDLRFSGGGIRGRDDIDSLGELAELPDSDFVDAARELGFQGVIIDSFAYEQPGSVDELAARIGDNRIDSPDGRFVFVAWDD